MQSHCSVNWFDAERTIAARRSDQIAPFCCPTLWLLWHAANIGDVAIPDANGATADMARMSGFGRK
jgi:hypothetical protein